MACWQPCSPALRLCLIGALRLAPSIRAAQHHALLQADAGVPFLCPLGMQVRGLQAGETVRLIACTGRVLLLRPCVSRCAACPDGGPVTCRPALHVGLSQLARYGAAPPQHYAECCVNANCESIALSRHNQGWPTATQHSNSSCQLPCTLTSDGDLHTPPAPLQRTLPSPSCCSVQSTADASQMLQHHGSAH